LIVAAMPAPVRRCLLIMPVRLPRHAATVLPGSGVAPFTRVALYAVALRHSGALAL